MQQERPDHTLQPTASANEAYLRLIGQSRVDWKSRAHFFAIAAAMMRRALVDHARQCRAAKRGGSAQKVTLTEAMGASDASNVDLLALDEPWRKRPPVCAATTGYDQGVKTALSEVLQRAGEFFLGKSPIHAAAGRIAKALAEMNIPFAVAGALAANVHGHTRTTEVVDILLTAEGLAKFRERWLGRGWVEQFPGSRGLRDSVHEININVILTGAYPGDGKPKPVAVPGSGAGQRARSRRCPCSHPARVDHAQAGQRDDRRAPAARSGRRHPTDPQE